VELEWAAVVKPALWIMMTLVDNLRSSDVESVSNPRRLQTRLSFDAVGKDRQYKSLLNGGQQFKRALQASYVGWRLDSLGSQADEEPILCLCGPKTDLLSRK